MFTVSELTKKIKSTLEEEFSQVSVVGEISNFRAHVSGHWYFNLKDSDAVICCTMWRGFNNFVFFTPKNGMKIIINGKITVYPPRGNYQIEIRSMKPAGAGELQAAFEILKNKLFDEGLFDEKRKKEIPQIPCKIGIVTAIDGAAFQDMISVAERRFPLVELIVAPSRVQGSFAAREISAAIKQLNNETDADVIIIARGGGTIEDLWAFNEEIVARTIFDSRIPVISGVGHEIDFTIADFTADLRAPTPSAAMELATPSIQDFTTFINNFSSNAFQIINDICTENKAKINNIINSYSFRIPSDLLRKNFQKADILIYKMLQNIDKKVLLHQSKLSLLTKSIDSHEIQRQLKKGFVLVKQNSKFIKRLNDFHPDEKTILKFFDGEINI